MQEENVAVFNIEDNILSFLVQLYAELIKTHGVDNGEGAFLIIQILDTLHDFAKSGNRNATDALNLLFSSFNEILSESDLNKINKIVDISRITKFEDFLKILLGSPSITNARTPNNSNCDKLVIKTSPLYERRAGIKYSKCSLENGLNAPETTWNDITNGSYQLENLKNVNDTIVISDLNSEQGKNYKTIIGNNKLEGEYGNKKRLAGLFLQYFFFGGIPDQPVYLTMDAHGGKTIKCLAPYSQVRSLITVQNVSDSAGTSKGAFDKYGNNHQTDYLFHSVRPEQPEFKPIYPFYSLFWSKQFFYVELIDEEFSGTNLRGFMIRIYIKKEIDESGASTQAKSKSITDYTDSEYVDIDYKFAKGEGSPQGPSAPYLSELINFLHTASEETIIKSDKYPNHKCSTVDLRNTIIELYKKLRLFIDFKPAILRLMCLLFDLKRAGDYEQGNVVKIIKELYDGKYKYSLITTGDVLCFIYYAFVLNISCILENVGNNSDLILHRAKNIGTSIDKGKYIQGNICENPPNSDLFYRYIKYMNYIITQIDFACADFKQKFAPFKLLLDDKANVNLELGVGGGWVPKKKKKKVIRFQRLIVIKILILL